MRNFVFLESSIDELRPELLSLVFAKRGRKVLEPIENVRGAEILFRALGVNGAPGRKSTFHFIVVDDVDAPAAFGDRLAAATAGRPSGGCALRPAETREPPMFETFSGACLELRTISERFLRFAGGLEKLSRTFIRAAEKMKPERQLFLVVERIGKPCAQAQLSFPDGLAASAAFRAAARRGLDRVRHGASVPAQLASGHKGVKMRCVGSKYTTFPDHRERRSG